MSPLGGDHNALGVPIQSRDVAPVDEQFPRGDDERFACRADRRRVASVLATQPD
jgi:hypothetical protein